VQGVSGVMSITGDGDSAPLRVGYPLADTVGGLTAAMAIAAALNAEDRGAFIDVSMLESTLATMGWVVSNYLIGGAAPEPHGNENPTSAPSAPSNAPTAWSTSPPTRMSSGRVSHGISAATICCRRWISPRARRARRTVCA
jgi:crotonobetainyl-CoA:carnitine CoA-transferase CaiB-like acyl-CoA transferase